MGAEWTVSILHLFKGRVPNNTVVQVRHCLRLRPQGHLRLFSLPLQDISEGEIRIQPARFQFTSRSHL